MCKYNLLAFEVKKKSTFHLHTVFITVCVFITIVRALCVLYFRCFFTLSPAAVVENTPLQVASHHVRGPGLLSCAWKRVVTMWACGVKLACQTPWAAARPRSVGPWTGEASYSRGSPCRRLTVTVRYHSDSVSITVSLPCNANGT